MLSFSTWTCGLKCCKDPVSWGLIGTLVVLEGLLSADNALVLAVMVKHLPEEKRKKHYSMDLLELIYSALLQLESECS